jgi:hypothetical protein
MVSTTRAEPPQAAAAPTLPHGQLMRSAAVAVLGSALSGMIAGTFYALVPGWMQGEGTVTRIALFMFVAVTGGRRLLFHGRRGARPRDAGLVREPRCGISEAPGTSLSTSWRRKPRRWPMLCATDR